MDSEIGLTLHSKASSVSQKQMWIIIFRAHGEKKEHQLTSDNLYAK